MRHATCMSESKHTVTIRGRLQVRKSNSEPASAVHTFAVSQPRLASRRGPRIACGDRGWRSGGGADRHVVRSRTDGVAPHARVIRSAGRIPRGRCRAGSVHRAIAPGRGAVRERRRVARGADAWRRMPALVAAEAFAPFAGWPMAVQPPRCLIEAWRGAGPAGGRAYVVTARGVGAHASSAVWLQHRGRDP